MLAPLMVYTQTILKPNAKVTYKIKLNLEESSLGLYEGTLVYDADQSIFIWNKSRDQFLDSYANKKIYIENNTMLGEINHVNYRDKTLTSLAKVDCVEERYLVAEELPQLEWNITKETRKILGYKATKATTFFRGRDYEAWFAVQIPFRMGPWKLQGLPGLILEVYDTDMKVLFTIDKIENGKDVYSVKDKFKGETIDLITYYTMYVNAPFEAQERENARNKNGGFMSITAVDYNFLEKSYEYLVKEREEQVKNKRHK